MEIVLYHDEFIVSMTREEFDCFRVLCQNVVLGFDNRYHQEPFEEFAAQGMILSQVTLDKLSETE